MKRSSISGFIVGAAVSAAAMSVFAVTCYEVIDRNDGVILRDTASPVDLSERGAAARDAMRNRGELLVIFETQTCMVIAPGSAGGSRTLSSDEIVAGWRSFGNSGFGGTYGSTVPAASGGGGISAPTPTNVGRTPAAQEAAAARRGRY